MRASSNTTATAQTTQPTAVNASSSTPPVVLQPATLNEFAAQQKAEKWSTILRKEIGRWNRAATALDELAALNHRSKIPEPRVVIDSIKPLLEGEVLNTQPPLKLKLFEVLNAYSFTYSNQRKICIEADKENWRKNLGVLLSWVKKNIKASETNQTQESPYLHGYQFHLECVEAAATLGEDTHPVVHDSTILQKVRQ